MTASLASVRRAVPVNTERAEVETGVERNVWSQKKRPVMRSFIGGFRHQPMTAVSIVYGVSRIIIPLPQCNLTDNRQMNSPADLTAALATISDRDLCGLRAAIS